MFDKWRNAEFEIAEAHCDGRAAYTIRRRHVSRPNRFCS